MSFDQSNPAHLLELKTEVETDPISMGYAAVADQTQPLLKLLNDPANNVGGETSTTLLTSEVLLQVIDVSEYGSNPVGASRAGGYQYCRSAEVSLPANRSMNIAGNYFRQK